MSGRDNQEDQDQSQGTGHSQDEEIGDLSERISEALAPTLSDVSVRVAEAVTESLAGASTPGSKDEQSDENSDLEKPGSQKGRGRTNRARESNSGDEKSGQSFIGHAAHSLKSSFLSSLAGEGGEQLDSLVDSLVDMLFSRTARGKIRELADHALQAGLHDILSGIDDPNERIPLYQDSLARLRPVVRQAVDGIFSLDAQRKVRQELHAAVPSIIEGDFDTAFDRVTDALTELSDYATDAIWDNSGSVLRVVQKISTELLEEAIEDAAEDKINPEEIQRRVQDKADEAREKVLETVGALQEGVRGAQMELAEKTGGRQRRRSGGMPPTGEPPGMTPPSGLPPFGRPPSGQPPSGRPPSGMPPDGVHPAVRRLQERKRHANRPRNRHRRRLPEA